MNAEDNNNMQKFILQPTPAQLGVAKGIRTVVIWIKDYLQVKKEVKRRKTMSSPLLRLKSSSEGMII